MKNELIDDGGPAFPRPGFYGTPDSPSQFDNEPHEGLSLRAHIATQVFAQCEASEVFTEASGLELPARAAAAVRAADALIAALKVGDV